MKDVKTEIIPINEPVCILGHTFENLQAVRKEVEVSSTIGHADKRGKRLDIWDKPYISSRTPAAPVPGVHVLEIYERYPCFDSSDYACEDRYFTNYFFSTEPFTNPMVTQLALLRYHGDSHPDAADIPDGLIHLYYKGEGDVMELNRPEENF